MMQKPYIIPLDKPIGLLQNRFNWTTINIIYSGWREAMVRREKKEFSVKEISDAIWGQWLESVGIL